VASVVRVPLYDDPLFRPHDAGPGPPEPWSRLEAVRCGLQERDLERRLLVSVLLREPPPRIGPASGDGIDRLVRVLALAHAERRPLLET